MAMTDLAIVRRSLISRWFATATTILTVGIAVGLLLVLIALRSAGEQAFSRGTGNMHLIVSADSSPLNSVLNTVFYAGAPSRKIPFARYEALAKDGRVEWALPVVQGDNYKGFPTVATAPDYFEKFKPAPDTAWSFARGRVFQKEQELVLGAEAAAKTGLKIGDTLAVTHGTDPHGDDVHTDFPFTVVGILAPTATSHDRGLFMSLTSVWLMHAKDLREEAGDKEEPTAANLRTDEKPLTGVYIRLRARAGSDTPPTLAAVFDELRKDTNITVAQPADQVRKLFEVVSGVDKIIFALAGAVLFSTAVTIMLVLYQAMELRRRQVAVLRVLGASRLRVFMLALTEAAVIGLASSLLGVALAFIGAYAVAAAVHQQLGLTISPDLDVRWVVAVAAGATALACLAGIVPAATAYRTDVLRNLRPIG
jgi:putative ABC transport system permease protein